MSGNVIRRNVRHGDAPRSIAASSRVQSNPLIRALTVSATNEVQNMMWAMTIVPKPRSTPRSMKSVTSDAPSTISGVVSGSTTAFRPARCPGTGSGRGRSR